MRSPERDRSEHGQHGVDSHDRAIEGLLEIVGGTGDRSLNLFAPDTVSGDVYTREFDAAPVAVRFRMGPEGQALWAKHAKERGLTGAARANYQRVVPYE